MADLTDHDWGALGNRLTAVLKPFAPPIGICFRTGGDAAANRLDDPVPAPNEHGRTGRVPAGCVFWIRAVDQVFATVAADHANCSVGSLTHGFLSREAAAGRDDVAAVLAAGWVGEADIAALPVVAERPETIVYGPLGRLPAAPDVVLLRISGLGAMTIKDAFPDVAVEGKPQCHIVAIAKERGEVAVSVGCALSRARTGMKSEEMTCAIPAARLSEIVDRLEAAAELDRAMARYAAADAKRFDA